jgi:hypothetical protein
MKRSVHPSGLDDSLQRSDSVYIEIMDKISRRKIRAIAAVRGGHSV